MRKPNRLNALANGKRLAVLRWLKDPERHFPRQRHADINEVGVCCDFLRKKLGVAAPTATRHMRILADAGFVRARRIGQFTYYKRVDAALRALGREIGIL
jgi:ArsR family transcriptional regulator